MNRLKGVGWDGSSEGGLLNPSVPPALLNTGRNWHRGPQIHFGANNLVLCLMEQKGPGPTPGQPLYFEAHPGREEAGTPGKDSETIHRAFLPAPTSPRPPTSPGSVVLALSAPAPWASQRVRAAQAQTLGSRGRPRAQHPGCWQQAEDTKLLTCTCCPGLSPFASQWYLNKVCSCLLPPFSYSAALRPQVHM